MHVRFIHFLFLLLLFLLTPDECSEKHLPSFVTLREELRAAGAEVVACVSGICIYRGCGVCGVCVCLHIDVHVCAYAEYEYVIHTHTQNHTLTQAQSTTHS